MLMFVALYYEEKEIIVKNIYASADIFDLLCLLYFSPYYSVYMY